MWVGILSSDSCYLATALYWSKIQNKQSNKTKQTQSNLKSIVYSMVDWIFYSYFGSYFVFSKQTLDAVCFRKYS